LRRAPSSTFYPGIRWLPFMNSPASATLQRDRHRRKGFEYHPFGLYAG
jgi:hypothetical protein